MSTFDPTKHGGGGGGGIPAGEYILAIVWFERRTAKSGGSYLRAKYQVCVGAKAGQTFFSNLSIDTSKEGSAGRLAVFCACVGQQEAFSLTDDKVLRRVFVGKPFKARVSVKVEGQYTNNDIERYVPKVTDAERRMMDGWVLDQNEDKAMNGGGSDDDDSPHPADTRSAGTVRSPKEDDSDDSDVREDDIPF